MQCNEFELVLTDAIDGVLTGTGLDRFQAHARVCRTCGPLFAEAEAGRNWLKGLTEVEPPASLVTNILASTTGVDTQRLRTTVRSLQPRVSWWEHVQASVSGYLEPIWATVRQPRFAMSFGMAFFALSVGLTVAGVKPRDISQISLRPSAIRHTYFNTQARVVREYLCFVAAAFHVFLARPVTGFAGPCHSGPRLFCNVVTKCGVVSKFLKMSSWQVLQASGPTYSDGSVGRVYFFCGVSGPVLLFSALAMFARPRIVAAGHAHDDERQRQWL